ncbi:G-type lectin S-receptor-like serine/threonine-protein kinase LECRK3 [Salvia divinorum]|uniref:G-type lectin S-receptor-like serine/threonine-protein kinase LECRK3 n=1 Tax=Salvia divinorum TaxID=28513 RepID=A0ABD1GGH1_SALDI
MSILSILFLLITTAAEAQRQRDTNPAVPDDVVSLLLTPEGRLVLRRRQGQDEEVISPYATIASASMLDTGNFVLYDFNFRIIWQSFDNPTTTLLPGQRISHGQEIFSSASETDYSKGKFRLKMQNDGFLVQYPINTPDTGIYAYYVENPDGAVNDEPSLRPTMKNVLLMLEGIVEIPEPPSPSSFP